MDFSIDFKKQIPIEDKVITEVADKITDRLDKDDSSNKDVADKKFDKQDEIFEALGIGKNSKIDKFDFSFGDTVYEKIKSRIALMLLKARSEKDFSAVNEFLKKFNINIDIEKFINDAIGNAILHPQEEEGPFGCTHMQNPDNPLHGHHGCK